jgi:hypothetical protein
MNKLVTPHILAAPTSTHAVRLCASYGVSHRNVDAHESLEKYSTET